MENGPVFVAGLERSGTTLMYALLASHPNIAMTRRTNLWTYFYEQYGDLGDDAALDRCLAAMRRYKRLVVLDIDFDRLRTHFRAGPATYGRLFALLEEQHAAREGKVRWGDKSLNTERYADAIFAAYPGARILHMIRDPRDRYASVQARWGMRRGGVGAGTAEWLSSAQLAKRNQRRHPDRYRIVRYEELAGAPDRSMREICAFIGEDYTPAVLSMEGAQRFRDQGSNSSYGAREAGVISTQSVGRFQDVLSVDQVAFMQAVAGRDMRELGYELAHVSFTMRQRVPYLAGHLPLELGRLLGWRARHQLENRRGRPLPAYRLVPEAEAA
jgi:hypothetical protein